MNEMRMPIHTEVIPASSVPVLDSLVQSGLLSNFYLAGGTGLALMLGHRRSVDFDFFTDKNFSEESLLQGFSLMGNLSVRAKAPETLHLEVGGVKISFLGYKYPLLFPLNELELSNGISVKVADIRDIGCMKISSISSRGSRRDFIDLYAIAESYPLSELLRLFDQKYSRTPYNRMHILKSLVYFSDAENEPMPDMLLPMSWNKVKEYFLDEVKKTL